SQFAKTVATLKYGDEVIIVEAKKEWSNIKSLDGKVEGWVPNSSLTTKKLIVKVKSNKGTSANAEELALAGKGWSEWFEQALEDNEPKSYNFTAVETIETYTASDADTIAFIKEGKLYLGGEE
ncbi:MAG: SH3 domain-containing protein, partial [Treponema sp.]|nr:SH3 domain-containing protein [Treponema sp.]